MRENNAHIYNTKNTVFLSLGTHLTDADVNSFHKVLAFESFVAHCSVSMTGSNLNVLLAVERLFGEVDTLVVPLPRQ